MAGEVCPKHGTYFYHLTVPLLQHTGQVDDYYAGAWQATTERCHRYVTDEHGKPADCPEPVVREGWRRDDHGRWYKLCACWRHAGQLKAGPVPSC